VVTAVHAARGSPAWLHGRTLDLLLGAGLGYVLFVPLVLLAGDAFGLRAWPLSLVMAQGLLVSAPHYGATLLRVYGRREDRQRYSFFAVHVSAALLLLFAVALHSPLLGSLLVTVYFSWSPWHFAGQNYGIALMFLGRRGVEVTPGAKRAFHSVFVISLVLTLLVFHTQDSSTALAPEIVEDRGVFDQLRLGIPRSVTLMLAPLLGVAYLAALSLAAALVLRRGARARDLLPAGLLVATQSLWYVIPGYAVAMGRPFANDLPFQWVCISTTHGLQYLWVTSYYARRADPGVRTPAYLARALLAGVAITVVPGLLFAPNLLGTVSWEGGLGILLFAMVNLHHFILDGAIWKLRDGRIARVLLHTDASPAPPPDERRRSGWVSPALWAAGSACLVVPLVQIWDLRAVGSEEIARLEGAARRLQLIRRESSAVLGSLGDLHVDRGDRRRALDAYREALSVGQRPDPVLLNNTAWLLSVNRGAGPESAALAVALAEEAVTRLDVVDLQTLDTLAVAYAAAGRYADAVRVAERAVGLARREGSAEIAALDARLALFRDERPYRED
jgi:tetratricopeptide (TPR) repeat protein